MGGWFPAGGVGLGGRRGLRLPKEFSRARELLSSAAVGGDPVVTDAHEAFGNEVEQEAAQELGCG